MRKIYLFAAALAAIATVSSCTSDDEIVQAPEPTQEPDAVVVNGEPITFTATVNNGTFGNGNTTRATVTSALGNFTLWGIEKGKGVEGEVTTTTGTTDITGMTFTKDGEGPTWKANVAQAYVPVWGENTSWYFYGLAVGGNALTFDDYGDPTGLKGNATLDTDGISESSAYTAKTFTYQMARLDDNVTLDLANQEDLIVAHAFGGPDPDAPSTKDSVGFSTGSVPLTFQHAFSNIELYGSFPLRTWDDSGADIFTDGNVGPGTFLFIKSITIHGLKSDNTYTFGSGWGDGGSNKGEITIEYPNGKLIFGPFFYKKEGFDWGDENNPTPLNIVKSYERSEYENLIPDLGSIMVIPQTFVPWQGGVEFVDGDCYIEVLGQYFEDAWSAGSYNDANGWDSHKWDSKQVGYLTDYITSLNLDATTLTSSVDLTIYNTNGDDYEYYDTADETFNIENDNARYIDLTAIGETNPYILTNFRLPFKIATGETNTLFPNKKYKLYIDFTHSYRLNGTTPLVDGWNP